MSDWKVREPVQLADGSYRPVVAREQDGKVIRQRLKNLEVKGEFKSSFETPEEARFEAEMWIRQEKNRANDDYIADDTVTIGRFIEDHYKDWRLNPENFKQVNSMPMFIRYLQENNWWNTKLIDISVKWCRTYRANIPNFRKEDGTAYALAGVYKDLNSELSHLLDRARLMELVTDNNHRGMPNPNKHLFRSEDEEELVRSSRIKEKTWTKEQLNKYRPLFAQIPKTRVYSAKKASHLEDRKCQIHKTVGADSWKVSWVDNDGGGRSKSFHWKKNGGRERAMIKAQAFAEGINKTLISEDVCVVEKGQFDGIDTEMWFGYMNISLLLGLRTGEITGLKFSDFSEDYSSVSIKRMRVIRYGEIVEDYPKAHSIRTISVPDELKSVLQALEQYHILNETMEYDYVLQYRNGGAIRPDYWNKQYDRVQGLVGIPETERLKSTHCGRYTHFTLLAEEGVPMPILQKRAGHKKMETTARYYVHIANDVQASIAIDMILNSSKTPSMKEV